MSRRDWVLEEGAVEVEEDGDGFFLRELGMVFKDFVVGDVRWEEFLRPSNN